MNCVMLPAFAFSLFLVPPVGEEVVVKPDVPINECTHQAKEMTRKVYHLGDQGSAQATFTCRPVIIPREVCDGD